MTTWISAPDPKTPGHWQIVTSAGQTVVYGLTKLDAENFVEQRNKEQKKKGKK